jgi:SAM-dependent methyltransferase
VETAGVSTHNLRMSNAYGDFAQHYDLLGWGAFARASAIRLKSFFKLQGWKPRNILDLACGSGELEKSLRGTGIRFTGVDLSSQMIRIARRKNPGTKFVVSDAATVRLTKKFDMVLLLFDSANHMNSLSHLARVFRNARRHLAADGYFIFDYLTARGLETWEQLNIKRAQSHTLFWYGHYYPEEMLAEIFIEAFVKSGRASSRNYRRVYQKLVEKTYPLSDIIASLNSSGFGRIAASPYDIDEKIEEATRLWFVCRV